MHSQSGLSCDDAWVACNISLARFDLIVIHYFLVSLAYLCGLVTSVQEDMLGQLRLQKKYVHHTHRLALVVHHNRIYTRHWRQALAAYTACLPSFLYPNGPTEQSHVGHVCTR